MGTLPPCRMCRLQPRLMQMAADYCAHLQAGNEKDMICLLKPVMRKRMLAATLEQVCGRPRYTVTAGEAGGKKGGGSVVRRWWVATWRLSRCSVARAAWNASAASGACGGPVARRGCHCLWCWCAGGGRRHRCNGAVPGLPLVEAAEVRPVAGEPAPAWRPSACVPRHCDSEFGSQQPPQWRSTRSFKS